MPSPTICPRISGTALARSMIDERMTRFSKLCTWIETFLNWDVGKVFGYYGMTC